MRNSLPPPPPEMDIPEELIEKILLKLPVKSLLILRSVSKSWRSLIDSKRFIKAHLHHSTINASSLSHKRLILKHRVLKQYSLRSLLSQPITPPSPLENPATPFSDSVSIIGCCNGLVCVLDRGSFFFWNPATGISRKLPTFGYALAVGFGWDESSDAYKVIAIDPISVDAKQKIYSSKTNSWRTVGFGDSVLIYELGQFVSGKLHWCRIKMSEISSGGGMNVDGIVTFDLKNEVFGMIELPCRMPMFYAWLGIVGGSISIMYEDAKSVDVWVRKESWVKVIVVLQPLPFLPFASPILVGVNGDILLIYGSSRHRLLEIVDRSLRAHLYVESLVSP